MYRNWLKGFGAKMHSRGPYHWPLSSQLLASVSHQVLYCMFFSGAGDDQWVPLNGEETASPWVTHLVRVVLALHSLIIDYKLQVNLLVTGGWGGRPLLFCTHCLTLLRYALIKKTILFGNFSQHGGGVFPNPKTFVNLPSIFLYAKFILRC